MAERTVRSVQSFFDGARTVNLNDTQQAECLDRAGEILEGTGLTAEFLKDPEGKLSMQTGVMGDNPAYTPVILLTGGAWPPNFDQLASLSSQLTSVLPVARITFEIPNDLTQTDKD